MRSNLLVDSAAELHQERLNRHRLVENLVRLHCSARRLRRHYITCIIFRPILNRSETIMHSAKFEEQKLQRLALAARDDLHDRVTAFAVSREDAIQQVVGPTSMTTNAFLLKEEEEWIEAIDVETSWARGSAHCVVTAGIVWCAFDTLIKPSPTCWSISLTALAAILLISLYAISSSMQRLRQLCSRGYCPSGADIFKMLGHSAVFVSTEGTYFSLNSRGCGLKLVLAFLSFSRLRPVEIIRENGQVAVEIWSIEGTPLRSVIFADKDYAAAEKAVEYINTARNLWLSSRSHCRPCSAEAH